MTSTYDPRVFAVSDIDAAKRIILTHEDSSTSERSVAGARRPLRSDRMP